MVIRSSGNILNQVDAYNVKIVQQETAVITGLLNASMPTPYVSQG